MRWLVVVLAVASLVAEVSLPVAADDADEAAVKKELKALAGTWKVVSRHLDGKQVGEEELKGVVLTHDEAGRISVRRGDEVIAEGTVVKLDPTKKPKTTDAVFKGGQGEEKPTLGIYEIEGNTLRLCHARPGDARPTEFSSKSGSGHALMVYEREKK